LAVLKAGWTVYRAADCWDDSKAALKAAQTVAARAAYSDHDSVGQSAAATADRSVVLTAGWTFLRAVDCWADSKAALKDAQTVAARAARLDHDSVGQSVAAKADRLAVLTADWTVLRAADCWADSKAVLKVAHTAAAKAARLDDNLVGQSVAAKADRLAVLTAGWTVLRGADSKAVLKGA
jgi:hypothetical protein